jgi:hypothetical protein
LGKSIIKGWVDSFLAVHAEQFVETKSVPQENPRLEVSRVFLHAGLDEFRDHVHQVCPELVFNLDEIGVSEWEDRCTRRVIVPSAMKEQTILYGLYRNPKHIYIYIYCRVYFSCRQTYDTIFCFLTSQSDGGETAQI